MQAILNIGLNEIDDNLLKVIRDLLSKGAEIVIRKEMVKFEEYDKSIPLEKVMREFAEAGYDEAFLTDLKEGFETSTIYSDK
jgi:hypothetical protein